MLHRRQFHPTNRLFRVPRLACGLLRRCNRLWPRPHLLKPGSRAPSLQTCCPGLLFLRKPTPLQDQQRQLCQAPMDFRDAVKSFLVMIQNVLVKLLNPYLPLELMEIFLRDESNYKSFFKSVKQINLPKNLTPTSSPFKEQEGPACPVTTTSLLSTIPAPSFSAVSSKQSPSQPQQSATAAGSSFGDMFKPKAG